MKNKKRFCRALIISDDLYDDSRKSLESLGVKVYSSFCNKNVLSPLSLHADMQLVQTNEDTYVCAPECYEYYKEIFDNYDFLLLKGNTELSSNYPYDIAYNITVTERYAIHNFKYTDKVVERNLTDLKCINVSQGYSRCSICQVSRDSFITSDDGVYKTFAETGINALKISNCAVLLPGFDIGFFGGATFLISDNVLAVNGNIRLHPDCEKIKRFCDLQGVELLSLSEHQIMDIGSAVVIK